MGGMYEPLAPCPSCRRHVRALVGTGTCPFCHASIHGARVTPGTSTRLARGALFVFASSLAACGGSTAPETPAGETGASDTSTKTDSVGTDLGVTDTGSVLDTGNPAPPYGIPPVEDTGVSDGTVDDSGGGMAKYGAPPAPK